MMAHRTEDIVARRSTPPAGSAKQSTKSSSKGSSKSKGRALWKVYGRLATFTAGVASLRAVNVGWRLVTGRKAPATPENPEVTMWEAAIWAVMSGAAAQLAKIVVTRKAVNYWLRTTGELPPGISPSELTPGIAKKK